MAASLGVAPDRLITAYQIHSPQVVVADQPWPQSERPRADAIVTRTAGLAIGVSTADCGPVLLADRQARRDRRRPCRLARRAHRRDRGDGRRDGDARRDAPADGGGGRPDDPSAELRGRAGAGRSLSGRRRRQRALLRSRAARRPCLVRSGGLCGRAPAAGAASPRSRTSGFAPTPIRRSSSPTAAPPIAPSRTTAGTSTPSCSPIEASTFDKAARRVDHGVGSSYQFIGATARIRAAGVSNGLACESRRAGGAPRRRLSCRVAAAAALAAAVSGCVTGADSGARTALTGLSGNQRRL